MDRLLFSRLVRLSEGKQGWVVGFKDETWWSRLALPSTHAWSEQDTHPRLVQRSVAKDDPDPKAISCYGLWLPDFEATWLDLHEPAIGGLLPTSGGYI